MIALEDVHKSFGVKLKQRLTERGPAHTETRSQIGLGKSLPRTDLAINDRRPHHLRNTIAQGLDFLQMHIPEASLSCERRVCHFPYSLYIVYNILYSNIEMSWSKSNSRWNFFPLEIILNIATLLADSSRVVEGQTLRSHSNRFRPPPKGSTPEGRRGMQVLNSVPALGPKRAAG